MSYAEIYQAIVQTRVLAVDQMLLLPSYPGEMRDRAGNLIHHLHKAEELARELAELHREGSQ